MSYYRKPVRRRRKPHTCVLCKEEETHDWDHICHACRRAWKDGIEYQQVKIPEGTREVLIAWHWKLYEFYGIADRYNDYAQRADKRFRNAALRLVNAEQVSNKWSPKRSKAVGLPENNRGGSTDAVSRYIIVGDEETEQALHDLYEACCDLMAEAYKKGEGRGKSFVTDLAEGKLTVEDLQRL